MKLIFSILKLALLGLLLAFAVKNTGSVTLHWFQDMEWQVPVVILVVGAFVAGAAAGLLMTVGPFLRIRRELKQLRKRDHERAIEAIDDLPAPPLPPLPASGTPPPQWPGGAVQ